MVARRIAQANAYAKEHNLVPFVASSPNYSLAEQFRPQRGRLHHNQRAAGRSSAAVVRQNADAGVRMVEPGGRLLLGPLSARQPGGDERGLDKLAAKSYGYKPNSERLDRVRTLAEEKSLSIPQIAMAYVMSEPLDIFALVGCRNKAELEANAVAADRS